MFKSFPQEYNELSYNVLIQALERLHLKVTTLFNQVKDSYSKVKLKEYKSYLYDLSIEFGLIDCDNSSYLYDLKTELVRVEKELVVLEILKF